MMNTFWLGLTLSLVLPLLPLLNAIFLLRRAIRPAQKTHWISLSASAMVFTISGVWLGNSVKKLLTESFNSPKLADWLVLNMTGGVFFAVSLLVLSGGFWIWLAWRQRKSRK
jgi:hypothetical protein